MAFIEHIGHPWSAEREKIAVMMTDGEYNTQYKSDGTDDESTSLTSRPNAANGYSSVQAIAQCAIEVYTVGFSLGGSQIAIDTLSSFATDANHFYNSPAGDALKQGFRDIARDCDALPFAIGPSSSPNEVSASEQLTYLSRHPRAECIIRLLVCPKGQKKPPI